MVEIQRAAKVLIRRQTDGRYLTLTCSEWPENPRRSQKPDFPGGNIEAGEQIEEGLQREVQEEVGMSLLPGSLQLGYCSTHFGNDISTSFLFYVAEVEGTEEITLSWEHESYQWYSASELLSLEIREPYTMMFQYLKRVGLLM